MCVFHALVILAVSRYFRVSLFSGFRFSLRKFRQKTSTEVSGACELLRYDSWLEHESFLQSLKQAGQDQEFQHIQKSQIVLSITEIILSQVFAQIHTCETQRRDELIQSITEDLLQRLDGLLDHHERLKEKQRLTAIMFDYD